MKVRLFVDRIEEGVAVLIASDPDIKIDIPVSLLPEDISEGDWIAAAFERDEDMRRQVRGEIDDLMAQLGDDP